VKFRTYRNTDLIVSEVGFGMWTISTGWWGNYTEGEALALMRKAFDLGVTLFDAADTYGNGLSEEYIAKAFPKNRDQIVIATKVGYDFVTHGEARGRGQREIPQDFSPDAIVRATEAALKRLKTDRIDLLQLHNIRMEQVTDDSVWKTLEQLKGAGKIRYYAVALGPAIGWMSNIRDALSTTPPPKPGRRRCFSFACRIHPECLRENTMPTRFSRQAIIAHTGPVVGSSTA